MTLFILVVLGNHGHGVTKNSITPYELRYPKYDDGLGDTFKLLSYLVLAKSKIC